MTATETARWVCLVVPPLIGTYAAVTIWLCLRDQWGNIKRIIRDRPR